MAEFQSKFTGQEVDNAIDKLRTWIGVDGTYPTVTISGVTYAVIWKSIPVSGTPCYGIGLHPTTGRIYEIYYNGSSYTATALDTDTKNTAGSTNSTSKLFLVGAGSQAANPQTFSNGQVYTTDGTLYLTKATDLSGTANNHPALIVGGTDTAAHLEVDANEIHAKATGTTVAPLYLNHDGGNTYLSGEKTYSDGNYLYSDSKKVSVDGHTHDDRYYTETEIDTKLSTKANDSSVVHTTGDETINGVKTFNAPTNTSGTEQATIKLKTANGGAIIFGKEGPNSGSMIRLDQVDGTCRLKFRSSSTAGAMVWEQPESHSTLYYDVANVNFRGVTSMNFAGFKSAGYLYTDSNGSLKKGALNLDNVSDGSTRKLANYLPLSGGNLTGNLALYTASGDSPRLTFQRGESNDALNDWSLYEGTSGRLYIQQRGQGSTDWETRATFSQDSVNFAGTISENGTSLSSKYLGKTAKAADADKLDGNDSTYYLNYNNLTNTPTLGTAAGNIPVLDNSGKLAESVIPAVAITDTYVVATETAMLALSAQKGDIAIRSDLNKSFVLQATPASTLANWKELLTPTDAVLSVNGKTGAVTLNLDNINDGSTRKLANYISNSLTSAKGDIIYASDANAPARLGIGSNGQFLSIANGVPKWVNNPNTDTHYTNYLQINGNGTAAIKFEQNANKTLNLKPGTNVSISAASGEITINSTITTETVSGWGYTKNAGTVTSVATSGTGISGGTITSTGTITLDSSSAGNATANKVVIRNAAGSIQTEKLAVSSGATTKATMQYNSTEDCIEFIFA